MTSPDVGFGPVIAATVRLALADDEDCALVELDLDPRDLAAVRSRDRSGRDELERRRGERRRRRPDSPDEAARTDPSASSDDRRA